MIPVWTGFDRREAIGWHAFTASVLENTREGVAFYPLQGRSDGTNAFTRARFLIPVLQRGQGFAIFADAADMICVGDIAELWELADPSKAVQVVKHHYSTRHPRKYRGTAMEAENSQYERKNWASLMIVNCRHPAWQDAGRLIQAPTIDLLQFKWIADEDIGSLPMEWNWLVDEYGHNSAAKVLHWTAGIPAWDAYRDAPMAATWEKYHRLANYATE